MSFLFGSAPQTQSVPITLQSSLSGPQQSAQTTLSNTLAAGPTSLFPTYGGQLTAPLDPLQTSSLSALSAGPGGLAPAAGNAGNVLGTAQNALTGILNSGPTDLNSYYQTNVLAPLQKTFQDVTLPSIMSASGGSAGGYESTSQNDLLARAASDFSTTLAATQGGLAFQTGQQNITNKLQAAQESPALSAAPTSILGQILSAGGVPQGNAQTSLSNLYNQYLQTQQFSQTGIQDLLAFLGIPTQTAANQPVVQGGSSGLLSSLLGNSGLGTAAGAGLASLFGGGGGGAAAGAAGGLLAFA